MYTLTLLYKCMHVYMYMYARMVWLKLLALGFCVCLVYAQILFLSNEDRIMQTKNAKHVIA